LNVVLVHDYLLVMRGAERSFLALADLYPRAPVATLLYDPAIFGRCLADRRISTSGFQRLRFRQGTFKALMPLLPAAAERLPVAGHDLVVSSSSAFAHAVQPAAGAVHVCYCHTPFRYAWYAREEGLEQVPAALRPLLRRSLERIRRWDLEAARRDTHYVANSALTQRRIREYWGREVPIVHPPVELQRFRPDERGPGDYFLMVSELVRHKEAEVALQAARLAGARIRVVGGGADEERLRALHGDHAEFLGRVDDGTLACLYARARALVMPNVEEFGITAVEAQASGRPVIAADGGGARETVVEGRTGLFAPHRDVQAMAEAMRSPLLDEVDPEEAVASAERFSVAAFQQGMRAQIAAAVERKFPAAPGVAAA
jgi:glycosyltransferase involved in cell wall biosynthesis